VTICSSVMEYELSDVTSCTLHFT